MVHPYRWLRPGLVLPAPFLQSEPQLTPGGSGVLADPARIDEEFRKVWLPALRNSILSLRSGCLFCLRYLLTGPMLADVVQRKGVSGGGLDGWVWRELKVLLVSWFD